MVRNISLIAIAGARWPLYTLMLLALTSFATRPLYAADATNGFDLSQALVPVEQIFHGGPPRDGIPALDRPDFVTADAADYLEHRDRVLGIDRNGVRKAYPVKILNYHEIVNDTFDREAIVVSYCPLCGTGMAFIASVGGVERDFGVSGLLYKNDVLLYDRQTESLWSQLMQQAVTGPMRGGRLQQIVMAHTTWGDWRRRHPGTLVLSTDTGFRRDYQRSPYAGYAASEQLYFPLDRLDPRYHPKELVIGLSLGGSHKAYPFAELARSPGEVRDSFAGRELRIRYDAENRSGAVFNARGEEIPSTISYWFAWQAFHPDTGVYESP